MPLPEKEEAKYAKNALALMEKYEVAPLPDNFAVWYHYASGKNKDLIREIDSIPANKLTFTDEICSYLHSKYVIGNRNQKVLDDAAITTQKVLLEVLRVVNEFSDETQSYNKEVDHYLEHVSQEFTDDNVKAIFKELIGATVNLKKSGENMSKKLEESTNEINSLRKNLQQVTIEAQRDFLTGVFNRKTFEKLFDEMAINAKESRKELCMVMIDIDHFKRFNDQYGHLLGDEVLKIVARSLTDTLKGRDVVARFGGEEFVVLLPDTPVDGALKVAEMIRNTIASKQLRRKDTGETYGTITVSMGVARFRPDSDMLPTLVKRADDALYQAKHTGRNRVIRAQD